MQSSKKKLLVVEAHSDDSAISIGGFLDKFKTEYETHFLLGSSSGLNLHHCGFVSREQRLEEYQNYVTMLNGTWHRDDLVPFDDESAMDQVPRRDVVKAIERVIGKVEPDILICQGPSFHHDHTVIYESVIAATRPTARFCPSEIYVMENPTYVHSLGPQTDFHPDFYCALTEAQLKRKLEIFRTCFPTQIRDGKNYLSEDGVRSWARYRGIEARCEYAEALRTYFRVT